MGSRRGKCLPLWAGAEMAMGQTFQKVSSGVRKKAESNQSGNLPVMVNLSPD